MAIQPAARRPMRADARRNYQQLLVAAEAAFAAHGVDASLEDIARTAGVGIGTLYRHFATRDALLEALLADSFERARARAVELVLASDPVAALASWLREFIRRAGTYRGLPASVTATCLDPASQLHGSCQALQRAAADLVARAQDCGALRTDVSATDVFLMASAIGWAGEQGAADPERTERLLGLLIDGLRVRSGQQ